MANDEEQKRTSWLHIRLAPEAVADAQQVADREYDGNLSMLVRIAVDRFVAERKAQVTTDTERQAA